LGPSERHNTRQRAARRVPDWIGARDMAAKRSEFADRVVQNERNVVDYQLGRSRLDPRAERIRTNERMENLETGFLMYLR
jgi:hypothetical protein